MNPPFKQPAANHDAPRVCTSRRRLLGQWPVAAALALVGMSGGVRAQPERKAAAAELVRLCRNAGLDVLEIAGLHYNPFSRQAFIDGNTDVNYLVRARRNA